MDETMEINSIIEFIKNETPENEQLLISAYRAVDYLLKTEQECIDNHISELISERDYDKVDEYLKMAKKFLEVSLGLDKWADKFGLKEKEQTAIFSEEKTNESQEDGMDQIIEGEKRVNYENFRVDESVPYDLMTDFRYMKPAAFSLDGIRYPARLWKLVLLKTCELLWKKNNSVFESFVNDKFMQGKTRIYFSNNKDNMVKPELIKGTEIYVETNLSANSIRDMIIKILDKYRIPHAAYQIFLSKDLSPLHMEDSKCQIDGIEESRLNESSMLNMQSICVDYDYKTGKCMNENSPYFIMECCRLENCSYIRKRKNDVLISECQSGKIYILPKKQLKKRICPRCGNRMERTIFPIEFMDGQELKTNNIYGCWCQECYKIYITEGTYNSFVMNKELENIKAEFIKDESDE